jgi:hypothetical protein
VSIAYRAKPITRGQADHAVEHLDEVLPLLDAG